MIKRRFSYGSTDIEHGDIVRLWMCRILTQLGGHKEFITGSGYSEEHIASELGLLPDFENEEDYLLKDFNKKKALRDLRKCAKGLEKNSKSFTLPSILDSNIKNLSGVLHLSEVEQNIIAFTVLLYAEEALSDTADTLGNMTFNKACTTLAVTLECPVDEIKITLGSNGRLSSTSIVYIDHDNHGSLRGKLEILSRDFASRMLMPENNPILLLRDAISSCSQPKLVLDDYRHIDTFLNILLPYLKKAKKEKKTGVNILIYGPPGTGKSQLTRVLANELDVTLYEISREDSDGDAIEGKRRLIAFRAAQSIFSGQDSLLLFDEVEDIFDREFNSLVQPVG